MADTIEQLRGLVLSAAELTELTNWPPALVEDYLNIIDNVITLAEILDDVVHQKLEEVETDFSDGSVPYVEGGFLVEDNANFYWDTVLDQLFALRVATDYVDFDLTADPDDADGRLHYDPTHLTLAFETPLGNIIQIGQELGDVGVNKTGGSAEGKVVYGNGVLGHRMTFDFADAREGGKVSLIGVCTTDNGNNEEEFITTFGMIHGIDTSVWPAGTKLYVAADATGTLTSTSPDAPNYRIWVATVVDQHANQGSMFVSPRLDFADGVTLDTLDLNGELGFAELSADPTDPIEGRAVLWMSDGTATGDDGDILIKERSGAVVEQISLKHKDFVATSSTLTTGTVVSGTYADTTSMFSGAEWVVSENSGAAPNLDARLNFTGVDKCPTMFIARWRYDGGASHKVTIELYNYLTVGWDAFRVFSDSAAYYSSMTMYIPQANGGSYVDGGGNAVARFYHQSTGIAAHDLHIDYVGLTHSLQGVI